jgi:hypothetical protein
LRLACANASGAASHVNRIAMVRIRKSIMWTSRLELRLRLI